MIIGLIEFRLNMPGNRSLKDKRTVVKSLKDRVRRRFNVAIAEVDAHDRWTEAVLAAVTVASDGAYAHQLLEAVAGLVGGDRDAMLADYRIQML
ncbi:MAG: DUF503 domain-containing protein [bacterium]|nr:DUF503 domain-containing protein [bacterium]